MNEDIALLRAPTSNYNENLKVTRRTAWWIFLECLLKLAKEPLNSARNSPVAVTA